MAAYPWHYEVDQGEDFDKPVWFSSGGVYTDLSGCTARAAFKADNDPESDPLAEFTCTIITNPRPNVKNPVLTNRAIRLQMAKAVTAELPAGRVFFELWLTDAEGADHPIFAGIWKVNARGYR
jgi:hypothetical protein